MKAKRRFPDRGSSWSALALYALTLASVAVVLGGCRSASVDPIAIQDAQIAARVKTALVNDPDLGTATIEVDVARGVARLAGTVRTQALADRAVAVTRGVQGVTAVQPELRIGVPDATQPAVAAPPRESRSAAAPPRESRSADDPFAVENEPRLLAVGVSFGWSGPRVASLRAGASIGPLVRLGSGRGFGPALALNWFQTNLPSVSPDEDVVSRIRVRPIMAGVSYTLASDRVSVSPSLVGGIAFNSLSIPETGEVDRIAVEVDHSLVWRPGVSVWLDVSRRFAINVSAGYIVTRLHVTFLENGRLVKYHLPGDTTIVHAGIAYKLF